MYIESNDSLPPRVKINVKYHYVNWKSHNCHHSKVKIIVKCHHVDRKSHDCLLSSVKIIVNHHIDRTSYNCHPQMFRSL